MHISVLMELVLITGLLSVTFTKERDADTVQRPGVTISTLESEKSVSLRKQTMPVAEEKSGSSNYDSTHGRFGKLYVTSTPEAASVSINDSLAGKTPVLCVPTVGSTRIGLTLYGYESYYTDITVTERLNDTMDVTLIPNVKRVSLSTKDRPSLRRRQRLLFGGITIVSAITSTVFYYNASTHYNTMESFNLSNRSESETTYTDAKRKFSQSKRVALSFFAATLIGGSGVVYTYLF